MTSRPSSYYTLARAVLAALPFGGSVDILVEHARQSLEYKARQTVGEIVDATGMEKFAERLASEPEVEAIFVQGLEAAMRTGYEAKRRLLGWLISAAVLDDAKVDEGLLFVLALRNLEAPTYAPLRRCAVRWRRSTLKGSCRKGAALAFRPPRGTRTR